MFIIYFKYAFREVTEAHREVDKAGSVIPARHWHGLQIRIYLSSDMRYAKMPNSNN